MRERRERRDEMRERREERRKKKERKYSCTVLYRPKLGVVRLIVHTTERVYSVLFTGMVQIIFGFTI